MSVELEEMPFSEGLKAVCARVLVRVALLLLALAPFSAAAGASFEPAWSGWMGGDSRTCSKFARERPAFKDMMCEYGMPTRAREDGTLYYDLSKFPPARGSVRGLPFFVNLSSRSTYNAKKFYFGKFRHDFEAYKAWKASHPEFRSFMSFEWGNDAYQPFRNPQQLMRQRDGRALSQDELDALLARMKKPENRGEFVALLRATYDRIVEWNFSDPKRLLIGDGSDCIGHLAAYWGAGAIGIETTRSHVLYQVQMMFCRGAARQFNVPWMWYIASYIDGSKDGKYVSNCLFAEDSPQFANHGPRFGISVSAVKRTTYLTYLSGANYYERESMGNTHFLKKGGPVRLSEEGENYEKFHAFVTANDRGEPFAPIALLVPADRGYTRFGGRAFRVFDYTHPDFMLDALMSVMLDFPQNRNRADYTAHVERVMCNSKYGDVFDAITPDFPDQTSFARTIGGYKAAVLVGAYGKNPALRGILRDYVKGGGTLVMTSAQLDTFPEAAGRAKKMSNPEFSELALGKGRVIVAATPYLTPWYGDSKEGRERALSETAHPVHVKKDTLTRYPNIEWLLDELLRRFVPVSVRTDAKGGCAVQWGLNRVKDGWLVYLVNNGGVVKVWNEFPKIREGGETAEVDLSGTGIRKPSVRELLTGAPCEMSGRKAKVLVPYGDIRILKVEESK